MTASLKACSLFLSQLYASQPFLRHGTQRDENVRTIHWVNRRNSGASEEASGVEDNIPSGPGHPHPPKLRRIISILIEKLCLNLQMSV